MIEVGITNLYSKYFSLIDEVSFRVIYIVWY